MPDVTSHGTRIRYDDIGTGAPALLFLPGWCTDRTVFRHLIGGSRRRELILDWRGHGESEASPFDFDNSALVDDALAVIEAAGARDIVPVALSHAGWIALELRRRLGERVQRLVLLDWIILPPPAAFLDALRGLQSAGDWRAIREKLFEMWLHGTADPELRSFVRDGMGGYGEDMWARAGHEISAAYAAEGHPLEALSRLESPVPTLHLYSQPADPGYLAAQQAFAAEHPWFSVRRLEARSHFPMFEVPEEICDVIERFVGGVALGEPVPVEAGSVPSPS